MSAVDTQTPVVGNVQVTARRSNPFVTSFLPGLVLGLVVGLFAGAYLVPLLQPMLQGGGVSAHPTQRRAMPAETPGDNVPMDGPANEQRPSDAPGTDPAMRDPNAPAMNDPANPQNPTPAPAPPGEPTPMVP